MTLRIATTAQRTLARLVPDLRRQQLLPLLGASLLALAQHAQAAPLPVNLPAQPLAESVKALARQAGITVAADDALLAGKQAPAVNGVMEPAEALRRLLAGSGLEANAQGAALVIRPAAGPAVRTEAALPEVRVVASQEAPPGELPEAFAGGQVARGGRLGLLGNMDFMDTPFSTINYTADFIENQQARTLADVITQDPSVHQVRSSNQLYEAFTVRGFQFFGNEAGFNGLYGVVPIGSIQTETIERVELFKGANAFLNGIAPFGSIGGGVNVTPKRATDAPLARLSGDFSSDSLFGGHLDIGRRFGEDNAFGARVNVVKRQGDTAIDRQRGDTELASVGLDYTAGGVRLSADITYQELRLDGTQGSLELADDFKPPQAPDARQNWSQSWYNQTTRDAFGVVRGEIDVTQSVTTFAAIGGRRSKYGELRSYDIVTNTEGDFLDEPYYGFEESRTLSGEVGLRSAFATGPITHRLSMVASRYEDSFSYSEYPYVGDPVPGNIYTYVPRPQPDLSGLPTDTRKSGENVFTSYALADTIGALDDTLQITVGARYQRVQSRSFDFDSGERTDSYDESALTPALGVIFKPAAGVSLYTSYIEGLSQGPTAPEGTVNQGQVFPPFKSEQIEAGVKIDFGRFATTMAVFQIARPNGFTDAGTRVFGLNGEQRNRVIEIGAFGEMASNVRLLAGAAFIQGKLTKTRDGTLDGKTAQGVPKFQADIDVEWDLMAIPGFTLTADLAYVSSQYTASINTFKIPSYTTVDLGARYTVKDMNYPITLRASVDNIFGSNYWSTAFRGLALGAPRQLVLSATIDF